MITGLIFAGQDTTRCQLGRILELFLHHPGQWALLSHRPELAGRAVAEGVRLAPATTIIGPIVPVAAAASRGFARRCAIGISPTLDAATAHRALAAIRSH